MEEKSLFFEKTVIFWLSLWYYFTIMKTKCKRYKSIFKISDGVDMDKSGKSTAYYHLLGLFEFYELYRMFLPLFREHREYSECLPANGIFQF